MSALLLLASLALVAGEAGRAAPAAPGTEGAVPSAESGDSHGPGAGAVCLRHKDWPLWERYAAAFLSEDGRIIDRSDGDKSTSEGQAYALFFALVANDRPRFDRILRWTRDNLAGASLGERLPAWKWGKGEDGSWGVLDPNSASDADLWMVYVLLEAARLWEHPPYDAVARSLAQAILERESVQVPGIGRLILPGPEGFVLDDGARFRLNPSYLPPQLLRRLATALGGPWTEVFDASVRVLLETAPLGRVPDWVVWEPDGGRFSSDPIAGSLGGYEAIRSYLWAAMLPREDLLRDRLLIATRGLLHHRSTQGFVPEKVDTLSMGPGNRRAPPGFIAVAKAQAAARGEAELLRGLHRELREHEAGGLFGNPPAYYDQNLALFAQGFLEKRYAFGVDGRLIAAWGSECL